MYLNSKGKLFQPRTLYPDYPFKCAAKKGISNMLVLKNNLPFHRTFSQESIAGCVPPNKVSKTKRKYEFQETRDPVKERCRETSQNDEKVTG